MAIAAIALVVTACNPGLVTSVAGNGTAGNSGDGGKATDASFEQPGGIAVLSDGSYDVVDQGACVIRHVSGSGTISTIAGTGTCGYSGDGGPATAAQINPVFKGFTAQYGQLAVDGAGNVYLADSGNGRIRRIATNGIITTVAGNGPTSVVCGGSAVFPGSLAFTPDGTLYVSCLNGVFKLMAGGSLQAVTTNGGTSMTTDKAGDLYYAGYNGVVYKQTPDGTVTTFVDLVSLGFVEHPPVGPANVAPVTGLSVGPDGSVYAALGPTSVSGIVNGEPVLATVGFNKVLRLGPGTATVIAGSGASDPGTGTQSGYGPQLAFTPDGIAATADNRLLVSSGHNVYSLSDANLAQPWSGTSCDPSQIKPGADLSNQDLSGSNFYRCDFTGVNLSNTNLSGANLQQAIFNNANLSGTNVSGANLTGAIFNDANLTGTDFSGASLDGAWGVGIIGIPASLPVGSYVSAGIFVPPDRELRLLNFSGLDLHGVDLHDTDLTDTDLRNTNLTGADLAGVNLTITQLQETNFTGADLAGANLSDVQLQDTNFTGADLSGAKLSAPNVAAPVPAEPSTAIFTNANLSNLVIPTDGAKLYDPIFRGANLTGADLWWASFLPDRGASSPLVGTAVTSGGIRGTPKQLPAGVQLISGYLVTSYADLTGANLHGASITNSDLTGVNLTNANLSHANLTGTRLRFATVTNTNFSSATAASVVANTLTGIPANAPLGVQFRTDATATRGAFFYPGVNLGITGCVPYGCVIVGVDLSGLDLSGLDLTDADLRTAQLESTNLAKTNLTNADLVDATGTPIGADTSTYFETYCPDGMVVSSPATCIGHGF